MPKPSKGKARQAAKGRTPPAASGAGAPIEAPPPGRHARPSRLAYAVIAVVLVCCLYPRHSWKTYRNVNEQARLYLVKAMVEEGVINIDNGMTSKHPTCYMNAGYSSGWCEVSYGVELRAEEITCRAMGHERCVFVMAPPKTFDGYVRQYREQYGVP